MHNTMKSLIVLGATLFVGTTAYAQYPQDFTKDQADSTIAFRRTEITNIQQQLTQTQSDATTANNTLQQTLANVTQCQNALYAMLGTDRNGFNAYREQLTRAESELSGLRSMSNAQLAQSTPRVDALESQIRSLRGNKLVLIPDHTRRVQTLSTNFIQMKRGMVPANKMYTVGTWKKDRDCLWNIAKKPDIYNDPFAWPKIWRANMETIHNPDIIHPGQQLVIATSAVTEADRDLTGYRHRH